MLPVSSISLACNLTNPIDVSVACNVIPLTTLNVRPFGSLFYKKEAVKAFLAQLLVPNKLPVNPKVEVVEPVTISEPEIIALPVYGKLDPPPPLLEEEIA